METIQIKKENKIICVLSSRYVMGYDNFQWSELALLIEVASKGFNSKEELLSNLENAQSRFFEVDSDASEGLVLDLDDNSITLPNFPIYQLSEVNKENCCIDLAKRDGHYYAVYENEEIEMPNISFDKEYLLYKHKISFEEFDEINCLVDSLLGIGYSDYILNNNSVVRLNCM